MRSIDVDMARSPIRIINRTANEDDNIDAILVQLPLPPHMDESEAVDSLRPEKDVDGFHPLNMG
jgi:methylenetetrahydrofolate dehydrogenase (NADP+)/methenyltetrahydrofolate cyclohydrolase